MKVLHVVPSLGIGGTEKMLLELCRGLDRKRFECAVVALKGGGRTADALQEAGVRVTLLGSPDGLFFGAMDFIPLVFRLRREILNFAPDVLHTWLTRANVAGRIAAKLAGAPVVVSSLRVIEAEKGYHLAAERWTQRWADSIWINCAMEDFAVREMGIPAGKLVRIPNGIQLRNLSIAPGAAEQLRRRWAGNGDLVVAAMGRLHAQKGFDVLLRAAAAVRKEVPGVRFWVAGDGPERPRLEALARRLNLEESVVFCGWVQDSLAFLSAADVVALSSRWEGMPNVVLEAMALRRAVVATDLVGTRALIESGQQGLLVKPEDPQALGKALLETLRDAGLRDRLGRAARERVEREFTLEKMIASYQSHYESLKR